MFETRVLRLAPKGNRATLCSVNALIANGKENKRKGRAGALAVRHIRVTWV